MLSDRAQGRVGFEIQEQAGSDTFVSIDHFETGEFAVFNALLNFVVVGVHTLALLRHQRSAKLAPIRQMAQSIRQNYLLSARRIPYSGMPNNPRTRGELRDSPVSYSGPLS